MARLRPGKPCAAISPDHRRFHVEHLECRRLLAVVTVDTDQDVVDPDDNLTSLREAIVTTNADPGVDQIVFDFGYDGPATIFLEQGELEISDALTITGDGPDLLTIDAQGESRVFNITAETGDFAMVGMTLTNGLGLGGGGIWSGGDVTVVSSTILGNSAGVWFADGGGIHAEGDVTVISSTISGNSAFAGGGIWSGGDVTVVSSTISANSASGGGGVQAFGEVSIISSTISGNSSEGGGGGISAGPSIGGIQVTSNAGGRLETFGKVTVTSSTISGNSAGSGGGLLVFGEVTVVSSTISDNSASVGGGIYLPSSNGDSRITNSIVTGNWRTAETDPPVADDLSGTGNFLLGYSIVGVVKGEIIQLPGTTNYFDVNPRLGPLANNGGPTQTHALLPGSPAVDAGDPTIQQAPTEYDQRGEPHLRVADGDLPDDIAIDMGAYEAQMPTSADFDSDDDVDGLDFLAWQRGYGTTAGATKPDGNSDDDQDVDASDLAAWAVSFGSGSVPLAAAISAVSDLSLARPSQLVAASTPQDPAIEERIELRGTLLALVFAEQQGLLNEIAAIDGRLNLETPYEAVFALGDPLLLNHASSVGTASITDPAEVDEQEGAGVLEEAVDKVDAVDAALVIVFG